MHISYELYMYKTKNIRKCKSRYKEKVEAKEGKEGMDGEKMGGRKVESSQSKNSPLTVGIQTLLAILINRRKPSPVSKSVTAR